MVGGTVDEETAWEAVACVRDALVKGSLPGAGTRIVFLIGLEYGNSALTCVEDGRIFPAVELYISMKIIYIHICILHHNLQNIHKKGANKFVFI